MRKIKYILFNVEAMILVLMGTSWIWKSDNLLLPFWSKILLGIHWYWFVICGLIIGILHLHTKRQPLNYVKNSDQILTDFVTKSDKKIAKQNAKLAAKKEKHLLKVIRRINRRVGEDITRIFDDISIITNSTYGLSNHLRLKKAGYYDIECHFKDGCSFPFADKWVFVTPYCGGDYYLDLAQAIKKSKRPEIGEASSGNIWPS